MTNAPEPNTRGPLFDPIFGGDNAADLSDHAWVAAMLEVEAALTCVAAKYGQVDPRHAEIVSAVAGDLAEPGAVDITALGAAAAAGGNPVIPLVTILRTAVARLGVPASAVHPGATSQDILDSALMLLTGRALVDVRASIGDAIDSSTRLARQHRGTLTAARTLGQQALPTTFGVVAAGWTEGLMRADDVLARAQSAVAVQFGGAAGTLAALHPHGLDIADALADELGLARQGIPWHTDRTRIAEIVGALGIAAGAIGKPALDITLLASTEVGEVGEDSPGGSSAMPHKRNPVAAITARAAVRRVPGLVATALASMEHEHQRAAGAWHAEWETLTEILRLVGGGTHRLAASLAGLQVQPEAMAHNLSITRGLLLAERVTSALSTHTDRAREIVTAACASGTALDSHPDVIRSLEPAAVRELLEPGRYLGHADDIVDRVLAAADTRPERH